MISVMCEKFDAFWEGNLKLEGSGWNNALLFSKLQYIDCYLQLFIFLYPCLLHLTAHIFRKKKKTWKVHYSLFLVNWLTCKKLFTSLEKYVALVSLQFLSARWHIRRVKQILNCGGKSIKVFPLSSQHRILWYSHLFFFSCFHVVRILSNITALEAVFLSMTWRSKLNV